MSARATPDGVSASITELTMAGGGLVESPGLALSLGRFGLPFFWVTRRLCR
jgi:hypothetical protein